MINYFNYFTEIEEHFQRARGTGLFLLSPLDWALIESWKESGVPLEAVLRGIDAAFEKWRSKRSKVQSVNSLAYCSQAVLTEAQNMASAGTDQPAAKEEKAAPFTPDELREFLESNAAELERARQPEIAEALRALAGAADEHVRNLEQLEQRLTALEDKVLAHLRAQQSPEDLFEARRELDGQLRSYRSKMTAAQIAMLERQFLDRRLFESSRLPRLSLFYFR